MTVVTPSGIDSCPACASERHATIYPQALDPITLDAFSVVQCGACGLAYTAPRPRSLDRYYPQEYRDYGPLVKGVLNRLYELRVKRWTGWKPEGGAVLEVGCGPGLMLAAFQRRGWRVMGIERNAAMAESARRNFGVDVTDAPIEALPADARFDLIVLFQVLEHIGDPVPLLKQCAKLLAPGGRVVINVPNLASWQSHFAGAKWLHLDVPRHLVHYTPETLSATLERSGLHLGAISFSSLEHDPYGWVESTISVSTGRFNTLTRFLMGLDPFSPRIFFSGLFAALLVPPAMLLAFASWAAGRGALMEAVAVRREHP